jgi:hypothetical protein
MANDTLLIWANAKTYNDPEDGIYQMAEELEVGGGGGVARSLCRGWCCCSAA